MGARHTLLSLPGKFEEVDGTIYLPVTGHEVAMSALLRQEEGTSLSRRHGRAVKQSLVAARPRSRALRMPRVPQELLIPCVLQGF